MNSIMCRNVFIRGTWRIHVWRDSSVDYCALMSRLKDDGKASKIVWETYSGTRNLRMGGMTY